MPKAGNSKKRKRESKNDEDYDTKKAKSKENDGRHEVDQEEDSTNVSNLPYEEHQEIDDIDEKLEQNAAKNNLTTINVRSILHVSLRYEIVWRLSFSMKTRRHIMLCCYLFSIPSSVFRIMVSLFRGRRQDLSWFLLHIDSNHKIWHVVLVE